VNLRGTRPHQAGYRRSEGKPPLFLRLLAGWNRARHQQLDRWVRLCHSPNRTWSHCSLPLSSAAASCHGWRQAHEPTVLSDQLWRTTESSGSAQASWLARWSSLISLGWVGHKRPHHRDREPTPHVATGTLLSAPVAGRYAVVP
jgi:hypothetical protein